MLGDIRDILTTPDGRGRPDALRSGTGVAGTHVKTETQALPLLSIDMQRVLSKAARKAIVALGCSGYF